MLTTSKTRYKNFVAKEDYDYPARTKIVEGEGTTLIYKGYPLTLSTPEDSALWGISLDVITEGENTVISKYWSGNTTEKKFKWDDEATWDFPE